MTDDPRGVSPPIAAMMEGMRQRFETEHPLFGRLEFKTLRIARGDIAVSLRVPDTFADGSSDDGSDGAAGGVFVHTGFLTIVLDSIFGMATFLALDAPEPIATINLKTDTLDRVPPGTRLTVEALCEGITDDVAIVRGRAMREDGNLVASAAATFMVGTRSAQVSRL